MSNILNNKEKKDYSNFKVIIADTEYETFDEILKIKENFSFINLSSEFAVSFIIEYEKINLMILSQNIINYRELIKKAERKKIKTIVLGENIPYPLKHEKVLKILIDEYEKDIKNKIKRKSFFSFSKVFSLPSLDKDNKEVSAKLSNSTEDANLEGTKHNEILDNTKSISQDANQDENKDNKIDINSPQSKGFIARKEEFNPSKKNFYTVKKIKDNNETFNIKTIKQKIVTIFRAKGGVGSTTIAFFLASIVSSIKTLIIDLNFNEGCSDLGYYLNTPKTPNLFSFLDNYNNEGFNRSIINVNQNIDIILPPANYEFSKKIDVKDIYCLTNFARKKYDLVIFDMPNQISEMCLGITDITDLLVLISDLNLGSIGRLLEIVKKYIYEDLEKILIINKVNNSFNTNIDIVTLKKCLNLQNCLCIPYFSDLDSQKVLTYSKFENLSGFKDLKNIALKIFTE